MSQLVEACEKQGPAPLSITELLDVFQDSPELHNALCSLAHGQMVMEEAYEAASETGLSPKDGQQPIFAYVGSTHPHGHESFFFGPVLLGEALVSRVPLSICMDRKGMPTRNYDRFCALAKSKGIRYLIHSKTTSSQLFRDVYNLVTMVRQEGGVVNLNPSSDWDQFVVSRLKVFYDVEKKGLSYYEKLGLKFREGDPVENMVLAMTAQQIMNDHELGLRHESGLEVLSVLQDAKGKAHYFWDAQNERFLTVPSLDHSFGVQASPQNQRQRATAIRRFLRQLPLPSKDAEKIGMGLISGFTEYLKALREADLLAARDSMDVHQSEMVYYSGCVDSRMLIKAILGPLLAGSIRVVASLSTKPDGQLEDEASLTIAMIQRTNSILVHSHHSCCGGHDAIYYGNADPFGKGAALPAAFQELSKERTELYHTVMSRGRTDQERLAYYEKRTGIRLASVADAHGLEQLLIDKRSIRASYPDLRKALYIYVDIANCRIYVNVPGTDRFFGIAAAAKVKLAPPARPSEGSPICGNTKVGALAPGSCAA